MVIIKVYGQHIYDFVDNYVVAEKIKPCEKKFPTTSGNGCLNCAKTSLNF